MTGKSGQTLPNDLLEKSGQTSPFFNNYNWKKLGKRRHFQKTCTGKRVEVLRDIK